MNILNRYRFFLFLAVILFNFSACSVTKRIAKNASDEILKNKAFLSAHTGISIYDPETRKYWYDYQGDKYFVPASNTKLPTCYAAMKYLGDSLVSFLVRETPDSIIIKPFGDPTFLNSEFRNQAFFDQLKKTNKNILVLFNSRDDFEEYGSGWSWNDYQEAYMAERSVMPVYGNLVTFQRVNSLLNVTPPILRWPYVEEPMFQLAPLGDRFTVKREKDENKFSFRSSSTSFKRMQLPFKTRYGITDFEFLRDTLDKPKDKLFLSLGESFTGFSKKFSYPTDSLLIPMMHRSDNFFAEQSLLMVSHTLLGIMNDRKIIDTLLKTDLRDLPQKPRWADGSGLSRYNLFSPRDLIAILEKMKNEFGMDRIKTILPTGGEGTISSYYKADSGYIFGKTGTLSGVVAFSGFLYTKKGKLLIFSTLVNNHQSNVTDIRRSIEKFLQNLRNTY